MIDKEVIRDFYGRVLGSITTDSVGNKTVRNFYGKILGSYDKKANITKDFYGRVIAKGDRSSALIPTKIR